MLKPDNERFSKKHNDAFDIGIVYVNAIVSETLRFHIQVEEALIRRLSLVSRHASLSNCPICTRWYYYQIPGNHSSIREVWWHKHLYCDSQQSGRNSKNHLFGWISKRSWQIFFNKKAAIRKRQEKKFGANVMVTIVEIVEKSQIIPI